MPSFHIGSEDGPEFGIRALLPEGGQIHFDP